MTSKPRSSDFIRDIIDADLRTGKHSEVRTRFPPEPNGYLHIGHAKSICLNFGLAEQYQGRCNLRFDDTNPAKEDQEYVDSICTDIRWLGYNFGDRALFASDYFEQFFSIAQNLIRAGKAYVCSLDEKAIRQYRGTLTEAGTPSPFRERSAQENLDLFARMRAGEFSDGAHVLRAKLDMSASNMKMRDPLLYRIRHLEHHRTKNTWPIYPMYDFAHPLEDAIEGITHSICTLEFENNRPLYDWVVSNSGIFDSGTRSFPEQTEFARLNLGYTILSKRKLLQLVEEKQVSGWDDPRMPTLSGMRRRGYRPQAIVKFCNRIGVSKNNSTVDMGRLEYEVRDDLNLVAPRLMAVLRPIKLVIGNYEKGQSEVFSAPFFPPDIGKPGARDLYFSRELFIEATDFEEVPSKGFRRMAPGRWIRLRYAYCVRCDAVLRDESGAIYEIHCTYDASTQGGKNPKGEKVWGIIHWVDAATSVAAEVRIYDRLFNTPTPAGSENFLDDFNPESLCRLEARVEAAAIKAEVGPRFQFERQGYFIADSKDSSERNPVFNRIIDLRDSWAKKSTDVDRDERGSQIKIRKSVRAETRPKSRSKAEIRAATRERDTHLASRFEKYRSVGLSEADADMLTGSAAWGDRLEVLHEAGMDWGSAAQWLVNVHPREGEEPVPFASGPSEFIAAVEASESRISTAAARKLWVQLALAPGETEALIVTQCLEQVGDDASLGPIVDKVLQDNADKVLAYRNGKQALLGFFVGQVMRASKGRANAEKVKEYLATALPQGSNRSE